MTTSSSQHSKTETAAKQDDDDDEGGVTMGWMPPWFYDALVFVFTLGRESRQRREILDLAAIQPCEQVLDVGCGTGTLAIMAADDGASKVFGVDPMPSMIGRARNKAGERSNLQFQVGRCQSLGADDGTFDVVLTTFTLHHLPGDELREKSLSEIKRVLVPGGRLLIVDFAGGEHHHHHSHFCGGDEGDDDDKSNDPMVSLVKNAGFEDVTAQSVGMMGAVAVLAKKPRR